MDWKCCAGRQSIKPLAEIYAACITTHSEALLKLSRIAVADAWFAKKSSIDAVCGARFHFLGRKRNDANLKYLYAGTGKQGHQRPKV